jgi:hypothetical protein
MNFRRHFAPVPGLLSAVFWSGIVEAASAPCVDSATIEKATLGSASGKHFYLDCAVIADGKHPFLARLTTERRAAATERLKDKTMQTLACSANPRDPARSGLQKKEMVALASCKPPRVSEVWPLP